VEEIVEVRMTWDVPSGLITGAVVVLMLTIVMVKRLLPYRSSAKADDRTSEGFAPAQYEPMMRLLSEADLNFLQSQPGYRTEMGAKFRSDRRQIFRMYLRDLAHDFHRLHAEARKVVAESEEQHAWLVGVLIRQKLTFWLAMSGVEFKLMVSGMGLGKVDIRGLVEAVEAMRIDLARFTQPAAI
jgi:hypothetical protein